MSFVWKNLATGRNLAVLGAALLLAIGVATTMMLRQDNLNKTLFRAARDGDKAGILDALKLGAHLSARDPLGQTPLHSVSYRGNADTVMLLVQQGAALNARDKRGGTPLHWAVINGRVENVKLLLERGADPDVQDMVGMTPMHWAVTAMKINDYTKAYNVRLLLDHKANPDVRDARGKTALDYAEQKHNLLVAEMLGEVAK